MNNDQHRGGHWDLRYGGISLFLLIGICGITILEMLRYTVFAIFD
jgi:hypothetical protein